SSHEIAGTRPGKVRGGARAGNPEQLGAARASEETMTLRWTALLALSIVAVAWAGAPAEAEWALDAYGGAAWTRSTDLRVTGRDDTGSTVDAMIFDIKTNTGVTA